LLVLAVLLYQQPFLVKRKEKIVPLHLAVSGAVSAGSTWPGAVEAASRSLLTPLEYIKAQKATNSSQRSLSAAYEKTERRLSRIVDTNTSIAAQIAAAATYPRSTSSINYPVVGSYLHKLGSNVAPLLPGGGAPGPARGRSSLLRLRGHVGAARVPLCLGARRAGPLRDPKCSGGRRGTAQGAQAPPHCEAASQGHADARA